MLCGCSSLVREEADQLLARCGVEKANGTCREASETERTVCEVYRKASESLRDDDCRPAGDCRRSGNAVSEAPATLVGAPTKMVPSQTVTDCPTVYVHPAGTPMPPESPEQGQHGPQGAPPPSLLRRPGLHETTSTTTMRRRIQWTVHASKLGSKDTQVTSPNFSLTCGGSQLPFRLIIYPKETDSKKGGASFQKSGGKAALNIKCNGDVTAQGMASKTFWIYVASDSTACERSRHARFLQYSPLSVGREFGPRSSDGHVLIDFHAMCRGAGMTQE